MAANRARRRKAPSAGDLLPWLLIPVGVLLVIAATSLGTLAAFVFMFPNLGISQGLVQPLALGAVLAGVVGVGLLVWAQRIPPLRFLGLLLAFAGVGLGLLAVALWMARGTGWETVAIGAIVSLGAGLGLVLKVTQQP